MPDGPARKSDEPCRGRVRSDDAAGTPAGPSGDGRF